MSLNDRHTHTMEMEVPTGMIPNASRGTVKESRSSMLRISKLSGNLCLVQTSEDPASYMPWPRWIITLIVAAAAMLGSFTTDVLLPTLSEISDEFSATPSFTNIIISVPIICTAIFPLYWSAASERFGRRNIYVVSIATSVPLLCLCATSTSIGVLLAARMLAAATTSSVIALGAAVIADIWEVKSRGLGMSVMYIGILLGPTLAPIVGGLLADQWGWRSTQWFLAAYASLLLVLIVLLVPDTLSKSARTYNSSDSTKRGTLTYWSVRPLLVIKFLRNPAVALTVFLASNTYFALKGLQISIQDAFGNEPYNFSIDILGISYLPLSIGLIVGNVAGGVWSDHVLKRNSAHFLDTSAHVDESLTSQQTPDLRFGINAWTSAWVVPVGLLWWGWSVGRGVMWVVPVLGLFVFGVSSGAVFSLVFTVLVEILPHRSASLTALDGFAENICAAVGSVIAQPIISKIGNEWLFTIYAVLAAGNVVATAFLIRHGKGWIQKVREKY